MELPALWVPCHITFHPGIIHHQVRERELLVNSLIESKMKKQMSLETLPMGANDSGTTRVMVVRSKEAAPGDPFWIYSASVRHGGVSLWGGTASWIWGRPTSLLVLCRISHIS